MMSPKTGTSNNNHHGSKNSTESSTFCTDIGKFLYPCSSSTATTEAVEAVPTSSSTKAEQAVLVVDNNDDDIENHTQNHNQCSSKEKEEEREEDSSSSSSEDNYCCGNHKCMATLVLWLWILVGVGSSSLFLSLGILSAQQDQEMQFEQAAKELTQEIDTAFHDYKVAGQWVQQACQSRQISRLDFRALYLNLIATGLEFQVTSFNPNITHAERPALEEEARTFYDQYYPHLSTGYQGIMGVEPNPEGGFAVLPRSNQSFYFPVHLLEPVEGNVPAIDFDLYSSGSRRVTIRRALDTWQPALTPRLQLVQETDPSAYSVILMHPGIPLPLQLLVNDELLDDDNDGNTTTTTSSSSGANNANAQHAQHVAQDSHIRPDSFSSMVIRIPDLLQRANFLGQPTDHSSVYIYDTYNHDGSDDFVPQFLGAAKVHGQQLPGTNTNKNYDGYDLEQKGDDYHHDWDEDDKDDDDEDNYSHDVWLEPLPEVELSLLRQQHSKSGSDKTRTRQLVREQSINIISDQTWLIVVVASEGVYDSSLTFVILAGALLFFLCLSLGFFVYGNFRRLHHVQRLKSHAQRERSLLVLENAKQAAQSERELNDFIAHEVRNPLAAAMSACSFVASAVEAAGRMQDQTETDTDTETDPLIANTIVTDTDRQSVQDDIHIIDSSLHFINDLLRNMLDMQRASSNQLQIQTSPTHLLDDVFHPVVSMLHHRIGTFTVEIDCQPASLIVVTDSLRLKQIVLNLARNSVKFVETGFIRIKGSIVVVAAEEDCEGGSGSVSRSVQIAVEDSGPGISLEKREQLFGRFQESLDSLNQGTGIGLSLCKTLVDLMGGELWIDDQYDSGIEGCPGTRFVVDLKVPPMEEELLDQYATTKDTAGASRRSCTGLSVNGVVPTAAERQTISLVSPSSSLSSTAAAASHQEEKKSSDDLEAQVLLTTVVEQPQEEEDESLPENLSVLFVDDDMVLRKLFSRSIKRVAPSWTIQEASNGETALRITQEQATKFDIIFMDQYMASVQRQLLGTETVRSLRAQGVAAKICGLSANDVEDAFREAGADSFLFKPFPCKPHALKRELVRIANTEQYHRIQTQQLKLPKPSSLDEADITVC